MEVRAFQGGLSFLLPHTVKPLGVTPAEPGVYLNKLAEWQSFGTLFVGLSAQFGQAIKSDPPGEGRTENPEAPLQEWSHPISNVLLENAWPWYILVGVRLQLTPSTFFEGHIGGLRGFGREGTALVADETGSLVPDEGRFYSLVPQDTLVETTIQLSLHDIMPFWKVSSMMGLRATYTFARTQFDDFEDREHGLTIGLTVSSY